MRSPLLFIALLTAPTVQAQLPVAPPSRGAPQISGTAPASSGSSQLSHGAPQASPLTQPSLSPGVVQLIELDTRFSDETQKGGGAAFGRWFAEDALTLNNGKFPVYGKARIAASATWAAGDYQLSWQPAGGQMGPSGDMGFTWGHYDGKSKDSNGNPVTTGGRYITVWKRIAGGEWKVLLDASADEPPAAGECCALPKP